MKGCTATSSRSLPEEHRPAQNKTIDLDRRQGMKSRPDRASSLWNVTLSAEFSSLNANVSLRGGDTVGAH